MQNAYKKLFTWAACGILLLAPVLAVNSALAQANKHQLSGTVSSAKDNSPLPGVAVLIKGTTSGILTDANGKFSLQVADTDIIEVSLIGFTKQSFQVNGQTTVNIALQDATTGLDEVVVVGFGTSKKRLTTGAIGQVKGASLEENHTLRVDQALQGQIPGVQVTSMSAQPGESPKIRMRGTGTIGNADPLFVVDGVPTNDIGYLNSADIASLDVVKDAASLAIYGTRAANGVVFITTKKGVKGKTQISYDGFYGIQNPARKLPVLNAKEYAIIMNEAYLNSGQAPRIPVSEINNLGKGTDWQEALYNKNAPTQSHTLNISGGNDRSVYSSSISFMQQEGTLGLEGQSQYNRVAFRMNSAHNVYKDILKFGQNFTYTLSNKRGVGVGNIYSNTMRAALNANPLYPVYDSTGAYARSAFNTNEANPVALMDYQNQNKTKTDRILGNVYLELTPIKGLTLRSDFGLDLNNTTDNSFLPVYNLSANISNLHSRATMGFNRYTAWNWDNTISYQRAFGKHNATVLLGTTAWEDNTWYVNGYKEDLTIPDLDHAIIDNGTNASTQNIFGNRNESALLSYFGRLNYSYDDKYLFTAIFRRDGSSRFGANNRFGNFPSFSAGWVASNEQFMKTNWLDFLKVRASWGRNGNIPQDRFCLYGYHQLPE